MLLVTLGQIGVDLYAPSLPYIAENLSSSYYIIQLTIPLYVLGFGLSQLIYGPLGEHLGRKPTLLIGLGIFLLGCVGCIFAPSGLSLLLFRTLQGLGIGTSPVNIRAIMRDVFRGKQMAKASALIAAIWAGSMIMAPALGGYIQNFFSWRANFIAMFLYALGIIFFAFFGFSETNIKSSQRSLHPKMLLKNYRPILKDPLFLSFSIASASCYSYFLSFATISPFILQTTLGLNSVQYGWALFSIGVAAALGSMICARLVHHLKILHVMLIGSALTLLASLTFAIVSFFGAFSVIIVCIFPFFGSLGAGIVFPNCTTGAMTHYKERAGLAGALLGFIQLFISFFFTALISHLSIKNALPLSLTLLSIAILLNAIFYLVIRPRFAEETDEP